MGPQDLRASQITGAGIKGSSGQNLGTINDVILNPTSGRIDFAVISLNASTAGATGSSAAGNLGSAAQLVPVPWSLLHPVSTGSASASSSEMGASQEQPSFVFTGDTSRLQGAPSFTEGNWPDISQPSWRHSVFSYYGVMHGSSMGGGEAPGGAGGTRSEGAAGSQNTSGSSSGNP
jgi:sporulation protein YlmC with PRC-barrel domain